MRRSRVRTLASARMMPTDNLHDHADDDDDKDDDDGLDVSEHD